MEIMRIFFVALVFALCCLSPVLADDSADKTVDMNNLRAAAENGDSKAQVHLADDYYRGRNGLPKDNAESIKWLLKAADQGNPRAQFNLAAAYYHGNAPLEKDYVQSHMWLNLMITQNNPDALALRERAVKRRDELEASMTTDQIIKANTLSQEWVKAHPNLPKEFLP